MIIRVPSDYLAKITEKIKNDKEVKTFSLETWYRYMFPYIPYRTGVLASTTHLKYVTGDMIKENGKVHIENDGIHFAAEYANRLYNGDGFNFSQEIHPNATAHWGDVAMKIHGQAIAKEITAFILTR